MALIVQKFGGTSVADLDKIRHVAEKVKAEVGRGNKVVVAVSAMAGVTDQLAAWSREMSPLMDAENWAEYDSIVASGEQVTSGLLALRLQEMDVNARSWAGWQLPLRTDGSHGRARIEAIDTEMMHEALDRGEVIVVAGFQGITADNRIATLGRGGSDTTAVAIAAALKADRCDIYTDVDGIYTTDPRIVKKARKLHKVAYEEILEMASQGAKVLQTRSVEMAMNYGVTVQVLSTFSDEAGTLLVEEDQVLERRRVTGITYSRDDARVTLTNVSNVPGISAKIFGPLGRAEINVDMIVQNVTEDGQRTDMTFTVPQADLAKTLEVMEDARDDIQYEKLHSDSSVSKVSVIGVGMRSHAGVATTMFDTLAQKGVNILVISTSEIKISVLIEEAYTELALRSLHTAFGLDAEVEA
jgi:aspartate kinase